jgi:hypothetical protein
MVASAMAWLPNVQSQRHVLARNLCIVGQELGTRRSTKTSRNICARLFGQVPDLERSHASKRCPVGWVGVDFPARLPA